VNHLYESILMLDPADEIDAKIIARVAHCQMPGSAEDYRHTPAKSMMSAQELKQELKILKLIRGD